MSVKRNINCQVPSPKAIVPPYQIFHAGVITAGLALEKLINSMKVTMIFADGRWAVQVGKPELGK